MSVANYDASSLNHSEILICIQTVGTLQENVLIEAYSKIRKHSKLVIPDAGRTIRFRFEVGSLPENSKWGFFQPHRRVMGLLVLASCSTAMEVALLHEKFQKHKDAFSDFIFDARCFVFGIESTTLQSKTDGTGIQFVDIKNWKSSDSDIKGFLTSVFYVLESKRLQMMADKSDRPPLLTAPFEKSQQNSSDSDSRSFRKKCLGRWKKHLADISHLAGLKMEALQNYHHALEYLHAVNDPIWVGGAQEGLCVTSAIVLFGASKSAPKSPSNQHSNKQVLDPRNLTIANQESPDLLKLCLQTPYDFIEQYKDAVINYSQNINMGIVELEACIKATKVMSVLHKFIQAAEFLQNAVYIALKVSDQERITKYSVLADLYAEINFHRKSAFYRRVAAMQCVAPHLQQPDWKKCYRLLQGTFIGYELDFLNDTGLPLTSSGRDKVHGWPQVKIRVLHELVFSARKTGRIKIANRYSLYLLMRLHQYLSDMEEKDACAALTSSRRDDSAKHSNEISLPSVDLYNLPTISDVEPQPLPDPLQPCRIRSIQGNNSVFLFTPSTYQSEKKKLKHIDFKWCVNSPANVHIKLFNPLRVHSMKVSDLRLICEGRDGATFYCPSLSIEVPPEKTVDAALEIVPKTVGTIIIIGYEATVFGERSQCYFRSMPWIPVHVFEVDVIIELPILQRANSCLSPDAKSKSRMMITLYRGETRLLEVPFTSVRGPVSHVEVTPKPPALASEETSFSSSSRQRSLWLQVTCDDVQNQLPVDTENSLVLPVVMMTESKFDDVNNKYPICSCQIKLQYSNAAGLAANWCRSSSMQLMTSMKPCIVISEISARQCDRQGYCIVSVKLCDVSEDDVIVCSSKLDPANLLHITKDLLEYEEDRVVVAKLSPDDTVTMEVVMATIDMRDCKMGFGENEDVEKLQEILSDNLALEWIIKDETSSRFGVLDLSSHKLDTNSVDNLLTPPLYWTMLINDGVANGKPTSCELGSAVDLKVVMKNITSDFITLIDVELEIFQDQENGFREWNMEYNVLCVGCQSQNFHDVKSGESVEFHCTLLFLLQGQYHVRLRRIISEQLNQFDQLENKRSPTCPNRSELVSYKQFSPEIRITAATQN